MFLTAQTHHGDRAEYKYVVYANGSHNTKIHPGSFPVDELQRKSFVQDIFTAVRTSNEIICEGLFRIDIMYSKGMGKMVLNELESLEAGHDSGNVENNTKVFSHLEKYWEDIIRGIIHNL